MRDLIDHRSLSLAQKRELSAAIGEAIVQILAPRKGVLFHAAGLQIGRRAFLFLAPSGGGKSTVLRYAKRGRTLHDDKMVAVKERGRWVASSVPMLDNRGRWGSLEGAPLEAILLIEKRKKPYLIRLSAVEAFPRVASFAIEPSGRPAVRRRLAWTLMDLVQEVAVYRLGYVLGQDVAKVVDRRVDWVGREQ